MVQLPFALSAPDVGVWHRLVTIWKSMALAPPTLIAVKRTVAGPVLVIVSVCGELRRPTGVSGKFRGLGVSINWPAIPLPVSVTVCGLPAPSLAIVRVAVRAP